MYGNNYKKSCNLCGIDFLPMGRNQKYCGSRARRKGCSWKRQQEWTRNTPSSIAGRKRSDNLPFRSELIKELGNVCRLCGTIEKLTLNHIVPVSAGGTHEKSNLEVLCMSCNIKEFHTLYKIALRHYFSCNKKTL